MQIAKKSDYIINGQPLSHKPGSQQVVAGILSRNVDLPDDEIAAKWYVKRMDQVISRPKKFKDWKVIDRMLYKHTKDELLDPLYSREESWRLVVELQRRSFKTRT